MSSAEHLVVTSGTLLRDERHEVVVQAVHLLQYVHRVNVALRVVVPASNTTYGAGLRRLVHALRLADTEFIDADTDGLRRASLAHASCFVSACSARQVPGLRDAIAAGVPIIATTDPAPAGSLSLAPDAGPMLVAEAILAIIIDPAIRSALVVAGRDSNSLGS